MSVIEFPSVAGKALNGWRPAEMRLLSGLCGDTVESKDAGGWETGATEAGDPQLYLLGPAPDHDCILCVSRLGPVYVLEDGRGKVLAEHNSLLVLAEQARLVLRRRMAKYVARAAVAWCAVRETFEEKWEPMLEEPVHVLTHIAPQLAAFA